MLQNSALLQSREIAFYGALTHRQSLRHLFAGDCRRLFDKFEYFLLTLSEFRLRHISVMVSDIFFQHYGLSTRLLDVTFNPLVALYMACCEEDKQSCDGVVYCGHDTERQNTKIAELTAKYVFENELQRMENTTK